MLKVLAAIQFRSRVSGETCLTWPFSQRFAIAKSRRIVRIESEKSGKCHSKIVHSQRLHTFNHYFPCGYGFNPTKNGEKTVERELTVRHVFVGLVEGEESGIGNPVCGIRNRFKCHLLANIIYFYTFSISRSPVRITITISSLTSQDIEQNVSETLAVVIKVLRSPYRTFCCYSKVYSAVT